MADESEVAIGSRDFWIKVVDMLQQNWALIDVGADGRAVVHFIDDGGRIFDRLRFDAERAAATALLRNGFGRFADDPEAQRFIAPPAGPFHDGAPNDIYSSGRFWR